MQHADVEISGHGRRIAVGEIVGHRAVGERPAVDRDTEILQEVCVRRSGGELAHVRRQAEFLRYDRLSVVVAAHDEARTPEPLHLLRKVEARAVVAPVCVEDVAGDNKEGHILFARERHQVVERASRTVVRNMRRQMLTAGCTGGCAVEVYVGRVDE